VAKGRPLYQRLADHLLAHVAQGRLRPGDRLPTESDLMREHRMSRITVRQALEVLRQRGLVERYAGRGTFVTRSPGAAVWTLETVEDVAQAGAQTDIKIFSWKLVRTLPPLVERQLALAGRSAYRLRAVRSSGGIPLYYEDLYVRADVGRRLRREDLDRATVLELIDTKLGIPLMRGIEEVSAGVAEPTLARRLGVRAGAPTLILDIVYFDAARRPVVYVKAWYRADRFTRRNELRRRTAPADPDPRSGDGRGRA
jgi:GntR family transcriptional regulator